MQAAISESDRCVINRQLLKKGKKTGIDIEAVILVPVLGMKNGIKPSLIATVQNKDRECQKTHYFPSQDSNKGKEGEKQAGCRRPLDAGAFTRETLDLNDKETKSSCVVVETDIKRIRSENFSGKTTATLLANIQRLFCLFTGQPPAPSPPAPSHRPTLVWTWLLCQHRRLWGASKRTENEPHQGARAEVNGLLNSAHCHWDSIRADLGQ